MVNKAIIIKTFNRPELLEQCLKSIFLAELSKEFIIIVVRQNGNNEVQEIINSHRHLFASVVETNPIGHSIDAFITNNMMLGYIVAFDFWKVDYVISVEEDVILSKDSLYFVDTMFQLFSGNKRFRGVNLGSQVVYKDENTRTFSLTRFGVHGPASMITRKTWGRLNLKRILENSFVIFDAQLEFVLKSGFMVAPNSSRFLDLGVKSARLGDSYSLQNSPENDSVRMYFNGLKVSFIGENINLGLYSRKDIEPIWRKDCRLYQAKHNPLYDAKEMLYPFLQTKPGQFYVRRRRKYLHK